jgi:hypothetical protein
VPEAHERREKSVFVGDEIVDADRRDASTKVPSREVRERVSDVSPRL